MSATYLDKILAAHRADALADDRPLDALIEQRKEAALSYQDYLAKVVELTKQTQIFATNIGSWVIPGILCALLYLAMSLPLGYVARRLEAQWKMPTT